MVLVEGLRQADVAISTGLSPPRVSAIVNKVWDVVEEHIKPAVQVEMLDADYAMATRSARLKFGDEVRIERPEEQSRFVGTVMERTQFYVVQEIGRGGVVIHDLAKLDRAPSVHDAISVQYKKGLGVVETQVKERGGKTL